MRLNHSWRWVAVIVIALLLVGGAMLAARLLDGLNEVIALVGVGVVAAVAAFWWLPRWQAEAAHQRGGTKDQFELENEARKTMAQALGGLFLVIGLASTWQQLVSTENEQRNAREVQLKASALEESEQITERYANAVEQLASDDEVVVLGAIHALSRIAQDSERDRDAVIRVLARWIQDSAPIGGAKPAPSGTPVTDPAADPTPAGNSPPSSDDVVRALRVISDLKKLPNSSVSTPVVDAPCVDLSKVALQGTLTDFDLSNVCLTFSDLMGVTLINANLSGAVLTGTNLTNATLINANLSEAVLTGTTLTGARLAGASFSLAILSGADLRGADLRGVQAGTLTQDQIDQRPIVNEETRLPEDLVLPPSATPAGAPRATPEPTPTPPPADFAFGDIVVTVEGANLRAAPSLTASILRSLHSRTRLTVIGSPQEADGFMWWPVELSAEGASDVGQGQDAGSIAGWVAGDALVRFVSPTLSSAVWGGTPARVTAEFGEDVRTWNADCSWYLYATLHGMDDCQYPAIRIALPLGTPLYAADDGTVEFAGFDTVYAPHHVNIRTADGQLHTYAHMSSVDPNVVVGGRVQAGQYLGTSGEMTIGGTTEPIGVGPFLFFEVRDKDGLLIDPEPILRGAPIQGGTAATPSANP